MARAEKSEFRIMARNIVTALYAGGRWIFIFAKFAPLFAGQLGPVELELGMLVGRSLGHGLGEKCAC